MVELYNKSTQKFLGKISEEELQFLIDNLEEEDFTDKDYYIDRPTLELLKENGMSSYLEKTIEDAMGSDEEVEIEYRKKD